MIFPLIVYAAVFVGAFLYVVVPELYHRARATRTILPGFVSFPAISYRLARNELVCVARNGAELRIQACDILSWSPHLAPPNDDCVLLVRNRPAVVLPCGAESCDACPHLMQLVPKKLRKHGER